MKKYQCDDLFGVLNDLVEKHVKAYKTDFNYDKEAFERAVKEKDKDFIWILREHGTQCENERLAFVSETRDNIESKYYLPWENIKVFYVHVDGMKDGKVSGSVVPVDSNVLYDEIKKNEVPAQQVRLTPKNGEAIVLPYEDYNRNPSYYYREHEIVKREYLLSEEDESKVAGILRKHHEERERAKEGDLKDLIPEKEPVNRFKLQDMFGSTLDVEFRMDMYSHGDNLYLGLDYYDEELDRMLPHGDVTVNIRDAGTLPYLHSVIDTNNNDPSIIEFLEKNGFGKVSGAVVYSGYCEFPVFQFNEDKLKEVCPEDFEKYREVHEKNQSLNEKLSKVSAGRGKKGKESKVKNKENSKEPVL